RRWTFPESSAFETHCINLLSSDQQIRIGVVPLPKFLLKLAGLVDDDDAFVGLADGIALKGPWRRTFEIDAGDAEAAAMTGAFEFLFRFEPIGCAAEVGACG